MNERADQEFYRVLQEAQLRASRAEARLEEATAVIRDATERAPEFWLKRARAFIAALSTGETE